MEIIANAVQTVGANQNVYFTDTVVCGNGCITHRDDSGLVSIKGITDQRRARYRVTFGGNIAVPTGGTIGPISLAIAIDGEPVPATNMIVTPAAVNNYFNIATGTYIDVPASCCSTIGVVNAENVTVNVTNANLIIERVA